jgi:uncharacterized protein (DUF1684 family)
LNVFSRKENFAMLRAIKRGWPALFLLTSLVSAADASYVAEIQKWRQDFDADVRTGGWLSLIGRFKIEEGITTIGSDASSTVKLPPALSTKRLGTLIRHGDKFQFDPEPNLKATVDGHPLMLSTMMSTKSGSGRIQAGNLRLSVRAVGEDFYLLAADSQNRAIQNFTGTTWFPIDSVYRVTATFTAYDHPEQRQIPLTHVDSKELFTSTGDVTFQLGGETVRLKSFIDDAELFVMFQDQTSGKETYGGGRFLHAPLPKDGKTVLDFNKAFNPYCSVNPYVMCPIPPAENRLNFKLTAGETYVAQE